MGGASQGNDRGRAAELRADEQTGGWWVVTAASTCKSTVSDASANASPSIAGCSTTLRTSMRAPSTTKNSGTKRPPATPSTSVERRLGPPIAATMSPAPGASDQQTGARALRNPGKPEDDYQRHPQIDRPAMALPSRRNAFTAGIPRSPRLSSAVPRRRPWRGPRGSSRAARCRRRPWLHRWRFAPRCRHRHRVARRRR